MMRKIYVMDRGGVFKLTRGRRSGAVLSPPSPPMTSYNLEQLRQSFLLAPVGGE